MPKLSLSQLFDLNTPAGAKEALDFLKNMGMAYDKLIQKAQSGSSTIKSSLDNIAGATERATKASKDFNLMSDKGQSEMLESAKAADAQFKAVQSLEAALRKLEAEISRLKKEKESTNAATKEAIRLQKQEESLIAKIAASEGTRAQNVSRLKEELKKKNQQTAMAAKEALGLISIYDKESAKLSELAKRYKDYVVSGREAAREAKALKIQHDQLRASIIRADQSVGVFNRNVGNYRSGLIGVAGAARNFLAAFGVIGGVTGIAYLIRDTFGLIKETERYNKALQQVTETQEEYIKQQSFLLKISNDYGINLNTLTESYTKFYVATKNTNLEGAETQRIFDSVAKASAVMGLSSEDAEGALKALGQMISKGKIQAEELRGQLGDRLPGAFSIMADALGVTTGELDKMLKQGQLMAEDVLPKFATQLEITFGLDKVDKVDTLQAAQTRLTNSWIAFVKSVEDGNGAIANFAKTALNGITNVLNALSKSDEEIASKFMTRFQIDTIEEYNSFMEKVYDSLNKQEKAVASLSREYVIAHEALGIYNLAQAQGFETIEQFKAVQDEFINKYGEEKDNLDILNAVYNEYAERLRISEEAKKELNKEQSVEIPIIETLTDAIKDLNDQRELSTSINEIQEIDARIKARERELKAVEDYIDGIGRLNVVRGMGIARRGTLREVSSTFAQRKSMTMPSKDSIDAGLKAFNEMKSAVDSIDFDYMVRRALTTQEQIDRVIRQMTADIESGEKSKVDAVRDAQRQINEIMEQSFLDEKERRRQLTNLTISTAAMAFDTLVQYRTLELQQLEHDMAVQIEAAGDNVAERERIEESYQDRLREARRKQAEAQKLATIFNIITNTAMGVSGALALTGILGPFATVLAATIATLGAAQLAIAIATPIPAFAKGTDSAPGGIAIVGEKGREIVQEPSGKTYLTGNKAELRDIPEGSKILTNSITERILRQSGINEELYNTDQNVEVLRGELKRKESMIAMQAGMSLIAKRETKEVLAGFKRIMDERPHQSWNISHDRLASTMKKASTRISEWQSKNSD